MRAGGEAVATLGKAAAATGALCVAVHVVTAASGDSGGGIERAVFLTMAAACLPCVWSLWRRPVRGVWRSTAVMYGGMLFVHLLLLSASGGGHVHGGAHPVQAGMWGGVLLAGVEVALACTVLASGRAHQPEERNRSSWPGRSWAHRSRSASST